MPKVTLQTIADRVGVSRMTVSNAFSRPDQLSAHLRGRILATAQELGYVGPDPSARALARGSTGSIGVLLTDSLEYAFHDEVAMTFLGAIAQELTPTGLALTLLSSVETAGRIPARDVAMDGALVYSCDPTSPAVDWLAKRGLPMVYIDQAQAPGIPSVNVDDRGGARAAAQHLVDLGHRRFGLVFNAVGGDFGFDDAPLEKPMGFASRERLKGWTDVLSDAGVEAPAIRVPSPYEEGSYRAGKMLLELDVPPTAILCFSDLVAIAVTQAAHDAGLDVPGDLSVIGFDDSPTAARLRPALTTVRQDFVEKGKLAASSMTASLDARRQGKKPRTRHHLLPTELLVRGSTARPRPALSRN